MTLVIVEVASRFWLDLLELPGIVKGELVSGGRPNCLTRHLLEAAVALMMVVSALLLRCHRNGNMVPALQSTAFNGSLRLLKRRAKLLHRGQSRLSIVHTALKYVHQVGFLLLRHPDSAMLPRLMAPGLFDIELLLMLLLGDRQRLLLLVPLGSPALDHFLILVAHLLGKILGLIHFFLDFLPTNALVSQLKRLHSASLLCPISSLRSSEISQSHAPTLVFYFRLLEIDYII